MIVSDIRTFLKNQVAFVDPSLKVNDSAFYDGDIGEGLIDRSYQVEINNITLTERTEVYQSDVDSVISIFGYGYRDEVDNYDNLLETALCIRDNCISLRKVFGSFTIIDSNSGGINAQNLPSDDNGFKIDINITLTIAYSREE